jgi:hypothetical protein
VDQESGFHHNTLSLFRWQVDCRIRKQQTLTGDNLPGGIGQPNFTINGNTNQISGFISINKDCLPEDIPVETPETTANPTGSQEP